MYYNEKCKHLNKGYNVIKKESTPQSYNPLEKKYTCDKNQMIETGCPCCDGFEK